MRSATRVVLVLALSVALPASAQGEVPSEPHPCYDAIPEDCPADTCRVMQTCSGTLKCEVSLKTDPSRECGGPGYYGQSLDCCPNHVRRCGQLMIDGSCDMTSGYVWYPECVPCGNDSCDWHENRCNCPEDCAPTDDRPRIRYRGLSRIPRQPGAPYDDRQNTSPAFCTRSIADPDVLQECLRDWVITRFGHRQMFELDVAAEIDPFRAVDLRVHACMESRRDHRRSERGLDWQECLSELCSAEAAGIAYCLDGASN